MKNAGHKLAINIPRRTIWAGHSSARNHDGTEEPQVRLLWLVDVRVIPPHKRARIRLSLGRCHRPRASDTQIDRQAEPLPRHLPVGSALLRYLSCSENRVDAFRNCHQP